MKRLIVTLLFVLASGSYAQANSCEEKKFDNRCQLEVTLGLDYAKRAHISGLFTYALTNRFNLAAHTDAGYSIRSMGQIVSIPKQDFQSFHFNLTQRVGVGSGISGKWFHHDFFLMAGPQYYRLKESHDYEHIEEYSIKRSTLLLDAGFLYSLKTGSGNTNFAGQLYLPLLMIPDNLLGITLSVGIRKRF